MGNIKYDQPTKHGFITNEDGTISHVRSGLKVSMFELTGTLKSGKPIRQVFTADGHGFKAMQMLPLREGVHWAHLTNLEQVRLTFTRN